MYLKKITLTGFKSFASKTEVIFASEEQGGAERFGVTAVVGPNGSGKSNIADAIRWVMGEQSAKNLRGKKTHDVIFGGSKAKGKMGSASVELVFDNSDRKVDIDFSEVSIMRKVHRSGEGEYWINGSRVRLLDVIDLFASIGIGKESQCVLNQGMSDAILSATPLERRAILEEAAGVKPYQIKRDRAIKKLASTRDNLEQTAQLIAEIEPRLRILKRQAKRAEERKEVESELRSLQEAYYHQLWTSVGTELKQYEEVLASVGREIKMEERKLDSFIEKQSGLSQKMQDTSAEEGLRREIADARRRLSELERERAQCRGRMDAEIERFKKRRTFDVIPVDLPFVRKRLAHVKSSYEEVIGLWDEMTDISQWKSRRERALGIVSDIDTLSRECQQSTVKVRHTDDRIKRQEEEHKRRVAEQEKILANLDQDIVAKESTISEKERAVEEAAGEVKGWNEAYFALEREIMGARRTLDDNRQKYNDRKVECARLEVRMEDLAKEIAAELGNLPQESGLQEGEKTLPREEAERRISQLKNKLAMIGGIDPLVAEEYKETQERYDFLTKESADLADAIVSLEKIVKEMNERIEKDFAKAFKEINTEFGKYFSIMFGGGEAALEKVKIEKQIRVQQEQEEEKSGREAGEGETEEESLSWGVEMRVRPPKKRVDRLSMLSGGERSLISLALLFAIISHNPPPFVVLDEVEAALDEANSARFGELLRTLCEGTQFIIITHNRETMRQADVLYGVTMEEGVSKLLSVKMEKEK